MTPTPALAGNACGNGKQGSKARITDAQIIRLYKNGWSQKDIAGSYRVTVNRTRNVLNKAGFTTTQIRNINATSKDIVQILINHGIEYHRIEAITDISFHAIREIVERENLQGVSKQARQKADDDCGYFANPEWIRSYRSGDSFVNICFKQELSEQELVCFFHSITEDDRLMHQKNLRRRLMLDKKRNPNLSFLSLGNKYNVSAAIVKQILKPDFA